MIIMKKDIFGISIPAAGGRRYGSILAGTGEKCTVSHVHVFKMNISIKKRGPR